MKLRYYTVLAVSIIANVSDIKSMNSAKKLEPANLELTDIVKIRKGENEKEIWYRAKLFGLDGSKTMIGHKYKIDTQEGKAGTIFCWKEFEDEPEEIISDEYFELLKQEYERRNKKSK